MTIEQKTPEQLMREDAVRQALERAAQKLESQIWGDAYARAFAKAAKMVRDMKDSILA